MKVAARPSWRLGNIAAVVAAIVLTGLVGCGEETPDSAAQPSGGPAGRVASDGEGDRPRDERAPLLGELTAQQCVGWGRVRLEWSAAVDNASPSRHIRYRLQGSVPDRPAEALSVMTEAGAISHTLIVSPAYTTWSMVAIDAAGNESEPSDPILIRTVPELIQVATGAIRGALQACVRRDADDLVCVGENGRYALWEGRGNRWHERRLPISDAVGASVTPEGLVELLTTHDRFRLEPNDIIEVEPRQFEEPPAYPLRRFLFEPSGLALWLDGAGRVWASNGGAFRRFEDPLLVGSATGCGTLRELFFEGERGFAWCESGSQYLLRAPTHGYRWMELPDHEGLPQSVRARGFLFGEGRQISMLTLDGAVWRYDLGGWRPLWTPTGDDPLASAMSEAEDTRLLWVGAGDRVFSLNALGDRQRVLETPFRGSIIYVAPPSRGGLVVSERGEVFDLTEENLRRGGPPSGFARVLRQQGTVLGLVAEEPDVGVYVHYEQGWGFEAQPLLADVEGVVHHMTPLRDGGFLLAVDAGEAGGQIIRIASGSAGLEPFLFPAPIPEEPAPEATEPGAPAMPPEQVAPPPHPSELLVGVPPSELPEPPPPAPPIRGLDVDPDTDTAVAVGEGGALWLHIEGGWLAIPPAVAIPMPFLSVRIIGDHRYLVGGVDGLILDCEWAECRPVDTSAGTVGDVRAFRRLGSEVLALGSLGLARRLEGGTWELLSPDLEPPFPAGEPPSVFLAYDQRGGRTWALADDGSVWLRVGERFRAMALVTDGFDLWVEEDGTAVVASRDALYRIEPVE